MTNNMLDTTDKQIKREDAKKTYESPQRKLLSPNNINTGTTSNVAENSHGYLTNHS